MSVWLRTPYDARLWVPNDSTVRLERATSSCVFLKRRGFHASRSMRARAALIDRLART